MRTRLWRPVRQSRKLWRLALTSLLAVQLLASVRGDSSAAASGGDHDLSQLQISPTLDHFECYGARTKRGTPRFTRRTVDLVDEFETRTVRVLKLQSFCNAVDKNGEGIPNPNAHLTCYRIQDTRGQKRFPRSNVVVRNQFGDLGLTLYPAMTLCLPSGTDSGSAPPNLDHFKCYNAKLTDRRNPFSPRNVTLVDDFGTDTATVTKPLDLCNPVDKNGEGIADLAAHFACYMISTASSPTGSSHRDVAITNQFGSAVLTLSRAFQLCVPSQNLSATPPSVTATPTAPHTTPTPTPVVSGTPSQTPTVAATPLPPRIADFTPKSGPVGTLVTITGTHLAPVPGAVPQLSLQKRGGGTMSAPIASFSDTSIAIVIPTSADSGILRLTVGNQGATSADPFVVVPASSFNLTAEPGSADVIRGHSTSFSLMLNSTDGFAQLATLSISGLPQGMTAAFKPQLIAAGGRSILTVTADSNQPLDNNTVHVTASARVDGLDIDASVDLGINVDPVTTSFIGRTVVADALETSLAGVTIRFLGRDGNGNSTGCAAQTIADAAGNFSFTNLPPECIGAQLVRYDGLTAGDPPGEYAGVDLMYTITAGQVTASPVLVHLPRIDDKETVMVRQNAPADQTFQFKTIPGLSVTVYAGTTFSLVDGTHPDPFPFTAVQVPVDRLPDAKPANPNMMMVFIVAFQPANAVASQPVAVTFPNSIDTPPGVNMVLMTLDPTRGQMVPYGTGTVSNDGAAVIPDLDPAHPGHRFGLVHFDWHGQMPPPAPAVAKAPPSSGVCPIGARPVDPASGIEVLQETDISLRGLRGGLSIERTYRTLSNEAGPFGIGTSHNYGYRLDTTAPQNNAIVNLIMPDGNRFPFIRGVATLTNTTIPALQGIELSVAGNGQSNVRFKDGTVFQFVPSTFLLGSVLESVTDPNGNRTSLIRDPARPARITEIVDPVGRKLSLTYDANDRIMGVTDPIGRVVLYTYNAAGMLETVTDPAGGVTRYDYDAQNRLSKVTDPRGIKVAENAYYDTGVLAGRAKEQLLAGGGRWSFEYTLVNPLAPTSPVRETTVTDPLGNKTIYRFNPLSFLLEITDALGQTRVFERESGTNRLLAITGSASCNVCGVAGAGDQHFTYDDKGNLLSVSDALGNTTSFTYESAFNQVESVTDPLQHKTRFAYGAGGNLVSVTDANQQTTGFAYDSLGQLTAIIDPLNNVTQIYYDTVGNPVALTDPLGNTSHLAHDGASRLTQVTDTLGRTTHIFYDALDRAIAVIDPHGNSLNGTYDQVGNLTSVTDARNNTTSFAYDPVARQNTRTDSLGKTDYRRFDLGGNLVEFVDRRGLTSEYAYDALNRLIGETYADSTVQRAYDQVGQLAHVTDTMGGDFDFTHDLVGRLLGSAGPFGTIVYIRDKLGRVSQQQVIGQPAIMYDYDPVGNLMRADMPAVSVWLNFAYDERNQLKEEQRSNGVNSSYDYNSIGQALRILHALRAAVIDDQVYTYDAVGNLMSRTSTIAQPLTTQPSIHATDTKSDRVLQRNAITYAYDENGNRLFEVVPTGTITYIWDARNRLRSITEPGGVSTSFQYSVDGALIQKQATGPGPNGTETYVIDDLSNVAYQANTSGSALSVLSGRAIDQHLAAVQSTGHIEFGLNDVLNRVITYLTGPRFGARVRSWTRKSPRRARCKKRSYTSRTPIPRTAMPRHSAGLTAL